MVALEARLRRSPVVAILGARQVGKTTLARALARKRGDHVTFFDLEDPLDLARLSEVNLIIRTRDRTWVHCAPRREGLVLLRIFLRNPAKAN